MPSSNTNKRKTFRPTPRALWGVVNDHGDVVSTEHPECRPAIEFTRLRATDLLGQVPVRLRGDVRVVKLNLTAEEVTRG